MSPCELASVAGVALVGIYGYTLCPSLTLIKPTTTRTTRTTTRTTTTERFSEWASREHKTFHKGLSMGDIREQRPDAALDVLGAACTNTGKDNRGSTRHVDWSINSSMSASMPTDHEAHCQTQRGQLRRVATTELRWDCSPETEAERDEPVQPSARSRETEQSKAR